MDVLGLVPARGGSKGIPRKNLVEVGGRSLLEWSWRAALESETVSRVVVSTDDVAIAAAARALGAGVVDRPAELAADDVPMAPVVLHALNVVGGAETVVLLQPTSPLRTATHVDAAVHLFRESGADSVVSGVRVPHNLTPESLLLQDGSRLVPLVPGGAVRRQDKQVVFARNGPAIVVVRADVVRGGSLYGHDCRGYEMDIASSVDVDTPFELELADWLLARRDGVR